jgi:hypothetical protein
VVDALGAVIEDSALVQMPVRSVNSHGHWASFENFLNFLASCNFCNSINTEGSTIFLALLVHSNIGIVSPSGLAIIFDPLKSSNSISSIASLVGIRSASRAVNKLLLA